MNTELNSCSFEKKFIDMMNMKQYSEMTIKAYCWHWDKFKLFKKNVHITRLSSQDINDYLVSLNDKVSDSFFNQAINAIRFFFKYVLNKKIKDYLVVRPKKAKTQPILLSDNEIQSLFDACINLKHKVIICLLFSGGLRCGEIINLKINDVDSECMIIRIKSGKGKKDRMVQLNPKVLELIQTYINQYNPNEYLFNGQFKIQYTKRSIEQFVKDLAVKAEINKRVYPHLLRHHYITGMLEDGEDIYTAQLLAGHSRTSTTIGYAHLRTKFISQVKSPIENFRI